MCQTVRGYWVHRALSTTPVSERGGRIPSSRSPERTVRFIPSCSRSSSEFLRSLSRPFPFGIRQLPGSLPLFATSPGASTRLEGSQVLDTFRPQVFSTSRRLSPPPALRACCIPQPRPGTFARSGASFSAQLPLPRRKRAAPLPLLTGPLSGTSSGVHDPAPSASRPSSAPSSCLGKLVVSLPSGHSPLRVSSPPGPILSPPSRLTRERPLLELPDQTPTGACAPVVACPWPPPAYCQREN
jgi:hypothetical protein